MIGVNLVRLAIAGAIILVCAVVLGWNAGYTAVPPPPRLRPIRWVLPPPRAANPAKDLAAILAIHPWGHGGLPAMGAARPKPAAAVPIWRLAGIVERGRGRFALVTTGSGAAAKSQYLRVGDHLPDGSAIVALRRDRLVSATRAPPGRRIYRLFGRKR